MSIVKLRIKIKYQGLNVVGTLFKIPQGLIAGGLIMQNFHNIPPLDIFPATGRILQYPFRLV